MLQALPDVTWVEGLPAEQIPAALSHLAALQVGLTARLLPKSTASSIGENDRGRGSSVPLLTAAQLADRLNVPESWIRSEQRARRIPSRRIGRYVRFDAREVEAALTACRQ